MALFDSQSGGNLLLWLPLPMPLTIQAGGTITSSRGSNRFYFPDLQGNVGQTRVWPGGSVIGKTPDGRAIISGVPLQFTAGILAAQASIFSATVTMAGLPASQPASGTGQLWNNGGIISVT
jgi:hypothetical protein